MSRSNINKIFITVFFMLAAFVFCSGNVLAANIEETESVDIDVHETGEEEATIVNIELENESEYTTFDFYYGFNSDYFTPVGANFKISYSDDSFNYYEPSSQLNTNSSVDLNDPLLDYGFSFSVSYDEDDDSYLVRACVGNTFYPLYHIRYLYLSDMPTISLGYDSYAYGYYENYFWIDTLTQYGRTMKITGFAGTVTTIYNKNGTLINFCEDNNPYIFTVLDTDGYIVGVRPSASEEYMSACVAAEMVPNLYNGDYITEVGGYTDKYQYGACICRYSNVSITHVNATTGYYQTEYYDIRNDDYSSGYASVLTSYGTIKISPNGSGGQQVRVCDASGNTLYDRYGNDIKGDLYNYDCTFSHYSIGDSFYLSDGEEYYFTISGATSLVVPAGVQFTLYNPTSGLSTIWLAGSTIGLNNATTYPIVARNILGSGTGMMVYLRSAQTNTTTTTTPVVEPTTTIRRYSTKTATLTIKKVADKVIGSKAFKLSVTTDSNGTLSYSSNNKKVATVDSKGKITPKGVGTAKITVFVPLAQRITTVGITTTTTTYRSNYKTVNVKVIPRGVTSTSITSKAKGGMVFKWKKVKNIDNYEVQIDMSGKNSFINRKSKTFDKNKISFAVGGFTSGKTYSVRIRTVKKVGGKKYCSKWSKVKKIKIK